MLFITFCLLFAIFYFETRSKRNSFQVTWKPRSKTLIFTALHLGVATCWTLPWRSGGYWGRGRAGGQLFSHLPSWLVKRCEIINSFGSISRVISFSCGAATSEASKSLRLRIIRRLNDYSSGWWCVSRSRELSKGSTSLKTSFALGWAKCRWAVLILAATECSCRGMANCLFWGCREAPNGACRLA